MKKEFQNKFNGGFISLITVLSLSGIQTMNNKCIERNSILR